MKTSMKTPKIRKRQRKTNYSTRMKLLKSDIPRVVVRKTNKYLVIQYVISEEAKDKIIVSVSSRDLLKYGWPEKYKGSLKSIPGCYLAGFLAGNKIKEKAKGKVILDIGLQRSISGNRLFAVLKGLVDSGLEINHNEKAFPSKDRVEGKHLDENVQKEINKIKQNLEK